MDREKNLDRFPEQHAPAKNTDRAFVRVGNDGAPKVPVKQVPEEKASGREKQKPLKS